MNQETGGRSAASAEDQQGNETPPLRLERRLPAASPDGIKELVSAGPEPPQDKLPKGIGDPKTEKE